MSGEFDLIDRYFRPIAAAHPAARDLRDDAACLPLPAGAELVISTDTAIAGVHCLPDAPAEIFAQRAVMAALSDLAAMGANPAGLTLALSLPRDLPEQWLAAFAQRLAQICADTACPLLGGDMTRHQGSLLATVTVLGHVPAGQAIGRYGAKLGDDLYVTGTIGGAGLGLEVQQGGLTMLPRNLRAALAAKYDAPIARLQAGQALRGIATAMLDISDGVLADAAHIASASNAVLQIDLARLPLETGAAAALQAGLTSLQALASFGDDYELLFTAPNGITLPDLGVPVTRLGRVVLEGQAAIIRPDGQEYDGKRGWDHFA